MLFLGRNGRVPGLEFDFLGDGVGLAPGILDHLARQFLGLPDDGIRILLAEPGPCKIGPGGYHQGNNDHPDTHFHINNLLYVNPGHLCGAGYFRTG